MLKVTWDQAARWRVARHFLDTRAPARRMIAVATRLCGLHAQVMSYAELTLWARVEGLTLEALPRALWKQKTLVKTWAMRGTLHLLPAADLPIYQAGLSASKRYLKEHLWMKYYGINLAELDTLTDAVAEALSACVMTREELMQEVGRRTSAALAAKVLESSWGTVLKPAAFTGRLCFGPSVGQRVRFTNPRTWLEGDAGVVDPESAAAEIARRFLGAFGPATVRDLARWWGAAGMTTVRHWIQALGDEVVPVDLEGAPAWMLAAHAGELRDILPGRSVRLLPGFDQYVIGASPHAESLLPGDFRSRVYRPQGWISPVLLVNGRMQGTWRHDLRGSGVDVEVRPFVPVPAWARNAAAQEAERLADFLGGNLRLVWKT